MSEVYIRSQNKEKERRRRGRQKAPRNLHK